jgi:hypothetical protein
MIRTKNIAAETPSRYVVLSRQGLTTGTGDSTGNHGFTWPFETKGVIKDVVIVASAAGTGTSWAVALKKNNSDAITTTSALFTVADGAGAVDALGKITKPANATAPVLGTVANRTLSKGDKVTYDVDVTSISGAGTFELIVVVDPVDGKQVAHY